VLVIDLKTINWELGRKDYHGRRALALAQALGIDLDLWHDPDSNLWFSGGCGQPPVLGRLPDGRLILVDGRRAAVEEGVGHRWLDREDMEALGVAIGTLNDTGERWAAWRLKRLLVRATSPMELATVEPPRDPTGVDCAPARRQR
jgi:hypothetical protein